MPKSAEKVVRDALDAIAVGLDGFRPDELTRSMLREILVDVANAIEITPKTPKQLLEEEIEVVREGMRAATRKQPEDWDTSFRLYATLQELEEKHKRFR